MYPPILFFDTIQIFDVISEVMRLSQAAACDGTKITTTAEK